MASIVFFRVGEEEDVDGGIHAFVQLDDAINKLSKTAVLDNGDVLITGEAFVNVPGEGSHEDTLSNAEMVALVVHGAAPDAADPDESEEPLALGPYIHGRQVANVMVDLTEYMQWQDWVTADDMRVLADILQRHQRARTKTTPQGTL